MICVSFISSFSVILFVAEILLYLKLDILNSFVTSRYSQKSITAVASNFGSSLISISRLSISPYLLIESVFRV